ADRAGFISVLYLHLELGIPLSEAQRQLRLWPFGHIRHANTGILDWFFISYREAAARQPGLTLRDWIKDGYERERVLKNFRPWYRLDWLTDRILHRE
ncbi:MAG: protein tyrosine phosphatase, partial [Acidithiobacillus sp.]